MNVEHAFTTRYESIEAFGLANEVLRPLGFELEDGDPSRSQQWRRAGNEKARSVTRLPQTLRMDHDRGRVTVKASAEATGKKVIIAQRLLLSYAQSLEQLLAERKAPKVAAAHARKVQSGIRGAETRKLVSTAFVVFALLGGVAFALINGTDKITALFKPAKPAPVVQAVPVMPLPLPPALQADPRNQVSVKPADPNAPKKHTAPVITVRRAGAAPQAAAKGGD